jgi:hypothetical protein
VIAVAMQFEPNDPPIDPPPGCVNRLMWQLARRMHVDHEKGRDGYCLICRPYQFYPCVGRQLADIGLRAAFQQPDGQPWRVRRPAGPGTASWFSGEPR